MNRLFVTGFMASSLWLAGSVAANAQYYGDREWQTRDRYNDRGYREDSRYSGRGYGDYRQAFYTRLQSDLERAARNGYLRGGDLRRFDQARHEIDEFQGKWSRGQYDRGALDDAIGATQRVANLRGLSYEDRAALGEDLAMMRNFRARMNSGYGSRGYGESGYYRPY